jgi:hypothetical protein
MPDPKSLSPIEGLSESESEIMRRLMAMRPEQHKDAPKPKTRKGEAQRRRREKERQMPNDTPP